MMGIQTFNRENNANFRSKILLILLPFWQPLIPPLGIACLKAFLQKFNYAVTAVDANIISKFMDINSAYFGLLREFIPLNKRGNFYNTGYDVLRNHLMVHLNYSSEAKCLELIQILIKRYFFCELNAQQILRLNKIVNKFYNQLKVYIKNLVQKEKPDVLGLSVFSGTLPASLFVFKLVKRKYPHIKTVMGGGIFADYLHIDSPNFKFFIEQVPYIDWVILGEGEILLLKLLKGEVPESQRVLTRYNVDCSLLDLNRAVLPDFTDLKTGYYPYMTHYISRSCPFQCSFCSETIYWGNYRKKEANQVVRELTKLSQKYDSQLFLLADSLLNPIIEELAETLLDSDISIYWDGYLRVDNRTCERENSLLWRRAGLYRARLGLESGSDRILLKMGKRITPEQIKQTVSSLAYAGIKTTTYWIVGYPGETEDDFQKTLDLLEELKDDIYEAECNPFNYYLTGQGKSEKWIKESIALPLYSEEDRDMLMLQTWMLADESSRDEKYQRVVHFVEHCHKLKIPNPYLLHEIYEADERWKKLHQNAVPSQAEFMGKDTFIAESKNVKEWRFASISGIDSGDFNF